MEKMNLKKVSSEIRAYLRTRIIYLKESGYEVKEIGKLLNVADDYVYYSVDNKSKYVFQELRIRLKHFKVYRNFKRRSNIHKIFVFLFFKERKLTFMFINIINSNSLTVDAADIHNWNEEYSSFYPEDLLETLKISISLSGIKKPIVLVKQNDKFYCVDGLRRLQIAQNLENENAWKHGDIPAVLDCSDNIDELYAACAFHKKELTTSQRAFFGAKWYYEETQALADWNRELRRHGYKIDQKIDTIAICLNNDAKVL